LLAQCRRRRQSGYLIDSLSDLRRSLHQCRTNQRPLPRYAPKQGGSFDLTGFSGVTRQQLGSGLGKLSKLILQGFNNTSMKRASGLTQKSAVGRVLTQRMFEKIGCVRRLTLPEEQTRSHEMVERRPKFRLRLANDSLQERMRELAPHCRSDLCDFLRWSKPVKSRHQRRVEACRDANGRRWSGCEPAAPSPLASKTAFAISSTNSGTPSVRSIMSRLMLSDRELFPVTQSIIASISRSPRRLRLSAVTLGRPIHGGSNSGRYVTMSNTPSVFS